MGKIAKLTWLHNGNYGSILQALALQKALEAKGYEVTDIDYKASIKTKLKNYIVNRNSPDLFLGKIQEAKCRKTYPNIELFDERGSKFNAFTKKNMRLTKEYHSPEELKQIADEYDIYICGSDQIWSPYLLNQVFYLNFLPKEKERISYATSFGVTKTTKSKEKKITSYLNDFQNISVREMQGKEFVKKLTGQDVPVCIDPTLLLRKEEWDTYTAEPQCKNKYVFAFLLTPNKAYERAIKKFAEKEHMGVIIVPTIQGPFNTGFRERVNVGPDEWLSLIKNSEYVFTDSFHAFIFSLIFEREVFLFKRFDDTQKRSQNSRIYSLTSLLNLESRIIGQENLGDIYHSKKIDYEKVKGLIQKEADASMQWLLKAIENAQARIQTT